MEPLAVAAHEAHEVPLPSGEKFRVVLFGERDAAYRQRGEKPPSVLFCVHGAGMCSSSFFVLATHLLAPDRHDGGEPVRVAAYDMRCHGASTFAGGEAGLTIDVLIADFVAVLRAVKDTFFPDTPRLYVAGHSLGGSVVANGLRGAKELHSIVAGVVLLDVVEGTAKWSLQYMDKFLQDRPREFATVEAATQWFLQRGGMKSAAAAAVTVPPLLRQVGDHVEWRSSLDAMAAVWPTWFDGLDDAFVGLPFPKVLCLANAERLDVALTVAQMQGKFQFEVLGNGCGHYVMDDQPGVIAAKVRHFIERIETMSEKLRLCTAWSHGKT